MRGKQRYAYGLHRRRGITPAGAGKTSILAFSAMVASGSPPQVRGKHRNCRQYAYQHGITPAGAGKTADCRQVRNLCEDHPRRCGENNISCAEKVNTLGSPPQVRGKHYTNGVDIALAGITPAGAGKTSGCCTAAERLRDHPRRCGENPVTAAVTPLKPGSPPQVRGKRYI